MQLGWSHKTEFGWFASVATGVLSLALAGLVGMHLLVDRYDAKTATTAKSTAPKSGQTNNDAVILGASIGDVPDHAGILAVASALKLQLPDLPWGKMLVRRNDKDTLIPIQSIFLPVNNMDQALALCARLKDIPPGCAPAIAPIAELSQLDAPVSLASLTRLGVSSYAPPPQSPVQVAATPPKFVYVPQEKIIYLPAPAAATSEQAPLKLQPGVADTSTSTPAKQIWLSKTLHPGDPSLVDFVAAGDTMMGSTSTGLNPAIRPGVDVASLIGADLAGIFRRADISFLNLEGPLYDGKDTSGKSCADCFAFHSPTFYAGIFANLGIDVANMANNHSGDYGEAGRASTMAALKANGIAFDGLDRDGARAAELLLPGGRRAAVIGFAPNNGTLNLNDMPKAQALVRGLKKTHDLVIVYFHGGAEGWANVHVANKTEIYVGENRGNVVAFSHAMIDAGADLLIGSGPHVPRAVEIYKNHLIAYSLGNFWTYDGVMNYAVSGLGPVLEAWLAPDGSIAGFTIHSTRQAGLGVPHLDPVDEAARYVFYLTKTDFPASHTLLEQSNVPRAAENTAPIRRKS